MSTHLPLSACVIQVEVVRYVKASKYCSILPSISPRLLAVSIKCLIVPLHGCQHILIIMTNYQPSSFQYPYKKNLYKSVIFAGAPSVTGLQIKYNSSSNPVHTADNLLPTAWSLKGIVLVLYRKLPTLHTTLADTLKQAGY